MKVVDSRGHKSQLKWPHADAEAMMTCQGLCLQLTLRHSIVTSCLLSYGYLYITAVSAAAAAAAVMRVMHQSACLHRQTIGLPWQNAKAE